MELKPFADWLKSHDRSQHTIEGYLRDVRLFAEWFEEHAGEDFAPALVTPLDVRSCKDYLQEKGYAPSTVARKLSALATFFAWAREQKLVASNPTEDIRRPGRVRAAPKWLTRREKHALERELLSSEQLATLRGNTVWARRDSAIVLLLLNAGLRVGEAAHLKLSDVEINERSGQVRVLGKGNKERSIPLNSAARRALGDWLELRPKAETCALLVGQRGRPLSSRAIQRIVKKYTQRAGLDGVTPHTLRHTFAKGLVDTGVSLDRVAMLLGHENINTTRIYTTPSRADLAEAVEKLI